MDRKAPLLLDVRSQQEFHQDAFPAAVNIPILNDLERKKVGIEYRHQGSKSAQTLGFQLVSGLTKEERETQWLKAIQDGCRYLACWRGGLRSRFAQEWIAERGSSILRIEGGTKALRRKTLQTLEDLQAEDFQFVIHGKTGSGKTQLLRKLMKESFSVLDLEAIAEHRGSAFGGYVKGDQPYPATFENRLAVEVEYLKRKSSRILCEGESRWIGKALLPLSFYNKFLQAPVIILESTQEERVNLIFEEYIRQAIEGPVTQEILKTWYIGCLQKIEKKLGGLLYREILALIEEAFSSEDLDRHRLWIDKLLTAYYDSRYDFSHRRLEGRIVFAGNRKAVEEFLRSHKESYRC